MSKSEIGKRLFRRDVEKLWRRTVNEFPHVSNLVERLKEEGHVEASNDLLEIYNGMVEHGKKLQYIFGSLSQGNPGSTEV